MAAPQQNDDFNIPPPSDAGNTPAPETNSARDSGFNTMEPPPVLNAVGRTELIIGAAGIIALAALLLFLRHAIRRSLIANRATIDSAGAAAWTWYFALLITGAMVISGIIGGLFGDTTYVLVTVGVAVVGLLFAIVMHGKAKRSA
jgi:hypothetical protein